MITCRQNEERNQVCYVYSAFSIFQLLAPQILHKLLLRNALGNMQTFQEYFTTIVYAKFGGQVECIMGNWKIVNAVFTLVKCINNS